MADSISISAGIAQRYATAVFELARDDKSVDAVESGIDTLEAALAESRDLRDLIASPIYSRDAQGRAITAVAQKLDLPAVLTNTLGLMASKRRLFVVPQLIRSLRERIAEEKGQVTADVHAAKALTEAQSKKLSETLKSAVGKDVKINLSVDEALIGGLVVKVGSKMIDTSIRSKLASLQNAMKEVG